jgi:cyanophycinase-like exopeptidase
LRAGDAALRAGDCLQDGVDAKRAQLGKDALDRSSCRRCPAPVPTHAMQLPALLHRRATRLAHTATLALCSLLLFALPAWPTAAQAQQITVQQWDFNEAAGTPLPQAANTVEGGSAWNAAIAGVATDGSGRLRIASTNTSVAYSYAPLNIESGGVFEATIVYSGWDIRNGAGSGSQRPIWNFGLRSAASTSSSLVADIELRALTSGVQMIVRDASNDYQTLTLPSTLPGALTLSLRLDKAATPQRWTLSYSIAGGDSGSFTNTLAGASQTRTPSHLFFGISGNHPGTAANPNAPPLVDSVRAAYEVLVVPDLPAQDGRPPKPGNLVTFYSGNPVQSPKQPVGGPGLLLMGGGAEVDAAFTHRAYPINNGGDIVVVRISGSSGYQNYLYSELVQQLPPELREALQPNSVMTMIVDTPAKANSEYVVDAIAKANLVWFAGGDQSAYIDTWRDTRLPGAVRAAYQRGAVIGGTSAGMVVSGEWMYDPGALQAVTSAEAVADPYRPSVVLSTGFFELPLGFNLVPEPHFANRNRMGRLLTFMARLRQDARTSLVYGIGLDEGSSLFIDRNNIGTFRRQGATSAAGYVLREDRRITQRVRVEPGQSLIYRHVLRSKFTANGQTFDFSRGLTTLPTDTLSVEGTLPSNPYADPTRVVRPEARQ